MNLITDRARLSAAVQAELPGLTFDIEHDDNSFLTVLTLGRRVESIRYPVADEIVVTRQGDALTFATEEMIRRIRQEAIDAYGLQAGIDRQVEQARREARIEQRKAWLAWLEGQRERRVVEGPDGPIEIKLDLPWQLSQIKEMIEGASDA